MDNDRKPGDRVRTCVRVTVSIEPMSEANDAVVALLSAFAFDLSQAIEHTQHVGSRASLLIVEEASNVLERSVHSTGELKVNVTLTNKAAEVWCEVRPGPNAPSQPVVDDWFPPDEPGATRENPAMKTMSRKRSEFEKAVQGRLRDRTQGGLGLVRLSADAKTGADAAPKKQGGGTDNNDGGSSAAQASVVPLPKKPK
jgi:hypothetical protein